MKTAVSAFALGFVVAFAAPAFASTTGAYVGDMLADEAAAPAPSAQAENKARENRIFKRRDRGDAS
jgi:hypothetical protein